jgi:hypothetical protein
MKIVNRALIVEILLSLGMFGTPLLRAAEPTSPASTDDELRKSLESESQDYDRALLGDPAAKPSDNKIESKQTDSKEEPAKSIADTSPAKPQPKPTFAGKALLDKLQQELGGAAQPEDLPEKITGKADQAPMAKVVAAMRDVQPRLAHRDAGDTTQHIEDQIVHDLDQLVNAARESCSGGQCNKSSNEKKPSACNKPGQKSSSDQKTAAPHEAPAKASNEKRTAALSSNSDKDTGDIQSLVKRLWGELPDAERQQMLALPDEEFLPQYEEQTKQYLRRLSDGKKAAEEQP